MDDVEQCELTPGPDAPYAAVSWIIGRLDDPAAEVLTVTLVSAVMTTAPTRILLTLTRSDGSARIGVNGSVSVGEDALTPVGREVVSHFAAAHGVEPDGAGLWAEIER